MRSIRFGLKQTIPILFEYIFVGLAFGILIREAGYSVGWAFLSAALIYAGSMQIVMVTLLTSG
ncbi:MAG TPA: AzlC family ABC transporter permease, partial [Bacillota bacterium]|nr:AzlC family ABC transporter permease [Bacillota bacterium]